MVNVKAVNGWSDDLPFNVKMKTQIGNGHSRVRSFYNESRGEVIHMVFNNRKTYTNKWYVVVTDVDNEFHRTEKLYRKLMPGVDDNIVTIWSGSSGEFIFEEEVSRRGDVEKDAKKKLMSYMKNNS